MTLIRPRAYEIRAVDIALAIKRAIETREGRQVVALRHAQDEALGASPASPSASAPGDA